MRNLGFKYQIGEVVTHAGFLKPVRQPAVQRFHIISSTLVIGPGGAQRFYLVRPVQYGAESGGTGRETLRVLEDSLAPLPKDECLNQKGACS
ncbi:MAG TPA: hypothetical protein VNN62_05555 [Methylomirabilota bacterium]|nr:hypothetical protein [Methylomirabilota bacterium]